MTRDEQRNMVNELKRVQLRMTKAESADFDMMAKRDRDDEDLDELTRRRLVALYDRLFPKRSKSELDALWAKLASGGKDKQSEE